MSGTRRILGTILGALFFLMVLVSTAQGVPGQLLTTFLNPTPGEGDCFGTSVAAVGGNVVIGAPYDSAVATSAGAAYLMDRSSGSLLRTFQEWTPGEYQYFGNAVAGMGDKVLVGTPYDDAAAINAGAVSMFSVTSGSLHRTFLKPQAASGDNFGYSVAAVGANVLVGAPYDDAAAGDAGAAYLFDGTSGKVMLSLQRPAALGNEQFGWSVAAMGGNILVGAPGDSARGVSAGAVYLFSGATGALLRTFYSPAPADYDSFGYAIAVVGNNILVGAPYHSSDAAMDGVAYLLNGQTGELLQAFHSPAPRAGDIFGDAVTAIGQNVLIGAPFDDTGAEDSGAAYLFDSSTGSLLQTIVNPHPGASDLFGSALAAVGVNAVITAPGDSTSAVSAGAAYLIEAAPVPGDANRDGAVDVGDLGILGANYGVLAGATWATSDFTGDGRVDVGDLAVLGSHFQSISAGPQSVPEPATLSLLALGAAGLVRRRG